MDNNLVINSMDSAMKFLLPKMTKTAKVIGGSVGLMTSNDDVKKQNDELHANSAKLIERAKKEKNPETRKRLLSVAREIDAQATQNIESLIDSATKAQGLTGEDYKQAGEKPVETAVKSAVDVGTLLAPVGRVGKSVAKVGKAVATNTAAGLGRAFANADEFLPDMQETVSSVVGANAVPAALQGAGKGIQKITSKVGGELADMAFKEPTKRLAKQALKNDDELGQKVLKEGGVKGLTEKGIFKNANEAMGKLEDKLQSTLKNSKEILSVEELSESLLPRIAELEDAGETASANLLKTRLGYWGDRFKNGIPVSKANEIKRTLYDKVNKAYGDQAAPNTEDIKLAAKVLKEAIKDKVKGVDEINKKLAYYGRIRESMLDKMAKGGGLTGKLTDTAAVAAAPFTGGTSLAIPALTRLASSPGVQKVGAQVLDKTGKVIDKTLNSNVVQKVGQIAGANSVMPDMSFSEDQSQQANPSQTNQEPNSNSHIVTDDKTTPTTSQEEFEADGIYDEAKFKKMTKLQKLENAMVWDIQNNGGKMFSKIKDMYDIEAKKGEKTKKTKDQLARESIGYSVDQAIELLASDPKMGMFDAPLEEAKSLFNKGDQATIDFNRVISEITADIAKQRGGTSFTPNEQKMLEQYSPKIGDSKQQILTKLQNLKDKIDYFSGVEVVGPDTTSPVMPDMTSSY